MSNTYLLLQEMLFSNSAVLIKQVGGFLVAYLGGVANRFGLKKNDLRATNREFE